MKRLAVIVTAYALSLLAIMLLTATVSPWFIFLVFPVAILYVYALSRR